MTTTLLAYAAAADRFGALLLLTGSGALASVAVLTRRR